MNLIGINLGSGKGWRLQDWCGLDKVGGTVLNVDSVFPFEDDAIQFVYSSHFFEHVDDATSLNLFTESYRVLRRGGVFRFVVPNFEIFFKKYREKDFKWFQAITKKKPSWDKYGVKPNITNLFLHWIASCDYNGPKGFYRGPALELVQKPEDVHKMTLENTMPLFCEWAQKHVSENPEVVNQHINWWNFEKFSSLMTKAGFTSIYLSDFNHSKSKTLCSSMFDAWKPHRKIFSLYCEAIK